jgi:hypothetical protein
VTNESIRQRAAEDERFIHRVARMIFELVETERIVAEWRRFAEQTRAREDDEAAAQRELASVLVGILDESRRMAAAHVAAAAGELAKALVERRRTLEDSSEDRMGNFEIQSLMSDYNQAETLSSNVQKKRACTLNQIIQKIG